MSYLFSLCYHEKQKKRKKVIELQVVQFVISNRTSLQREFDFEITRMISDLIIYMKKFPHSDWLRAVHAVFFKTVQKIVNSVQKEETNQAF